jgi:hypothetical protein
MILLGTQACFQQDCGHPVPHFPGTAALCINYHQTETCCRPKIGLRGYRLRSAQCRLGCRNSPGKGCQALGCTCRQLAHCGTGQAPSVDGGQCKPPRLAGLCHTGDSARLRATPRGTHFFTRRRYPAAGGALGHCRSCRQGRPHTNNSGSGLGESWN